MNFPYAAFSLAMHIYNVSYFTKRFGKTFSNNSHLEKVLLIGNLITDLETLMPKKHQSKSMIKN